MNTYLQKIMKKTGRIGLTGAIVILALIGLCKTWAFYTESPWTRDAKFTADVIAIAPDVSGLISQVPVVDNQQVAQGQILFVIDQPRYQQQLAQASADVAYYQTLTAEKKREAGRRMRLGVLAMSQEAIDQSNNQLQTVQQQLAKAIAARDLAQLDLQRTVVRAPAAGWITNLNAHTGEFITRGTATVALVKQNSYYVLAYLEETKLSHVAKGDRVEITPLGSDRILPGTVDSIAAGVTNNLSTDGKGLATIDNNLEWVRLAQRIPVKILLGAELQQHPYPAGTTATIVITGKNGTSADPASFLSSWLQRLREFG